MKKIFFLLLIVNSTIANSQVTVCADSVKVSYNFQQNTNSSTYSIKVDTFDLDSGSVIHCSRLGDSPNTLDVFTCSTGYWSKHIPTFNTHGDISEDLVQTGSATGWKDDTRTVFTYDAITHKKLSESNQTWDGSTWNQNTLHSWIYNASGFLIEETVQNYSPGNTYNLSRVAWNFTGNTLNSKTIQKGNLVTWINDINFLISYDGNGVRDSLTYQTWDTASSTWNTIGVSPYIFDSTYGMKLASFSINKTVFISGTPYPDSSFISIDTLENTIYHYQLSPAGSGMMGDHYGMSIEKFKYVNNILRIFYLYSADYYDDHSGHGIDWFCTNSNGFLYYDSAAYLIKSEITSACVMPNTYTLNYYYNANHILLRETQHLDANVSINDYDYQYYFGRADSVIAFVDPFDHQPYYFCQGDVFQPNIIAAGGCGNYHYNWTPTTGLSSDTIPDPYVVVGDSITYTITVTDGNGLSGNTHYSVFPQVQLDLAIDTATCIGCPMTIATTDYHPYYVYEWYHDGLLIPNSDTSSIAPTEFGAYYAVIHQQFSNCFTFSDTVFYMANGTREINNREVIKLFPNPSNSLSQLSIGSGKSQRLRVSVYSMTGGNNISLFDGNAKDLNLQIDGQKFNPGVYLISITGDYFQRQIPWVVTR